ncbi:MAG: hypothetical protein GX552_03595 [Chloroflexi bacterium]|nr:hypothetical protein [Chloroflexota bacterium]
MINGDVNGSANSARLSREALLDRARGCAVGAAVGDALGMPLEFGPARRGRYQVRAMQAGRLPAGAFTDDTEMALALAESLIARDDLDTDDVLRRFVDWYRRSPADVGNQLSLVLSSVRAGRPRAEIVRQLAGRQGNGSVMRCYPVALRFCVSLPRCLQASIEQSDITHPDPLCGAACALVNAVIWHGLRGADAATAVERALEAVELPDALRRTVEQAPGRSADELQNTGWALHAVESAVWGLLTTDSFAECVIQVANLGNDADTSACVVGAMAGAVYGLDAIPLDWREALHGRWPIHSERVWRVADFVALADALVGRGGE